MELHGLSLASVHPVARILLALGVVGLAGCASAASSDVESDSAPTTVEGVIHVEQSTTIREGESSESTVTSVSAKFLRVLPEDASRAMSIVGSRVVTPHEGECAPIASLSPARIDLARLDRAHRSSELKGQVELVDVGDLVLRATAAKASKEANPFEVRLMPRAFPDVGDLVSGVFYTQPDVSAANAELPSPGSYVLAGSGASVVEPFTISVDAPATPSNIRIAGQSFGSSKSSTSSAQGRDIAVEWDAVSPGSSPDGSSLDTDALVYVDVQGTTPYRCSFRDTGAAQLPADVLSRDDAGHSVTVSVHRVREENVRLRLIPQDGTQAATVRFDFSRSGRLLVE
jgi:hypothetical protein